MRIYTTSEIARILYYSNTKIRAWSKEFSVFLSESANPSPGEHRRYTDEDLAALAHIVEMKLERYSSEKIKASLQAGERFIFISGVGSLAQQVKLSRSPEGGPYRKKLKAMRALWQQLEAERVELETEIATRRGIVQRLQEEVDTAHAMIGELRVKIALLEASQGE